MSTSTIFIKKPINYRQSLIQLKEKYKELSPILSLFLWTFSGFYAASKATLNSNISGITLSFTVYDLLLVFIATSLLYRGLATKNILLILPWVGMTAYTIYYNHYLGLMNTLNTLKKTPKTPWLPWASLTVNIILLITRVTLAVRVLQLCVNMWFKRKIEELKKMIT